MHDGFLGIAAAHRETGDGLKNGPQTLPASPTSRNRRVTIPVTMRGVILDQVTFDRGDLDLSQLQATLPRWEVYAETDSADVATRIRDCEIVITNKVVITADDLAAAAKLRLICAAATGFNHIDVAAARARGISVCNVRAYATASVVQHVFALLLALTTSLNRYQAAVQRGDWMASRHFCLLDYPIREVQGRTLGIVGYGELGRAVGKVARAFGMQVLIAQRPGGSDTRPGRLPLPELLARADVISLHCPLTRETRGLIGSDELGQMRADAILINTARGGIVDEKALAAALRQGRLGGAGIDVLAEEPPAATSPLLAADIPNLIVTPHVAWASQASRQRLVDELAENIRAFLADAPRNVVN